MNIYSSDNMAYKNQNYMTNPVLKAQADRLQKGYVNPNPITYSFISYADDKGVTKWGEGTVETTGIVSKGFTEVQVKTNTEQEFVGQKFYITSDAATDGTIYPLYLDAGKTAANIYVSISTQEETFTPITYSFISYADSEGETKWAEGTVETTGVTENGFTEVQVKTNTEEEFIGQKFYITSDAKTDGTIYPLYSDAGTTSVNIYVSISTQSE